MKTPVVGESVFLPKSLPERGFNGKRIPLNVTMILTNVAGTGDFPKKKNELDNNRQWMILP